MVINTIITKLILSEINLNNVDMTAGHIVNVYIK